MRPHLFPALVPAVALAGVLLGLARPAAADTVVIKRDGDHPRYIFEAEPHLLVGALNPPGPAHDVGFGVGFRGTIQLLDKGFIRHLNDSVGIGFGFDWLHYSHGELHCNRAFLGGPNNQTQCYDSTYKPVSYFYIPVVMQWNFWISRNWSVFGEPGAAFRIVDPGSNHFDPVAYVGGRWHFADFAALTLRVGYPDFSVGVSFLL